MMADVVSAGTAAGTGLPSGTYAKTGTAQYDPAAQLKTDAWLMGYNGDIAFAIVVQNSGGRQRRAAGRADRRQVPERAPAPLVVSVGATSVLNHKFDTSLGASGRA